MKDTITTPASTIKVEISIPDSLRLLLENIENIITAGPAEPVNNPDEIWEPDDVCRRFQIPKATLYQMTMRKGPDSIPRFKVGRHLRFRRSEIEEWFEKQRVG